MNVHVLVDPNRRNKSVVNVRFCRRSRKRGFCHGDDLYVVARQ